MRIYFEEVIKSKWGHECALIYYDWCPSKNRRFGHKHEHTQEKPWKDTLRRWPFRSHGERTQKKPNLPTPSPQTFVFQNYKTKLLFKPLSLRYFVKKAPGNRYKHQS